MANKAENELGIVLEWGQERFPKPSPKAFSKLPTKVPRRA